MEKAYLFVYRLYRGTTDNNVINALGKVPPTRCGTQAALTEGAQVMTAASTLALIIQVDKYDVIILLAHDSSQALAHTPRSYSWGHLRTQTSSDDSRGTFMRPPVLCSF